MSKKAIGLTEDGIEIGLWVDDAPPAENAFISFGACYKDTATLETLEGQEVDCECEEYDDPEDSEEIPGKTVLKYSTSDLDPETCHKVFGGTYAAGVWTAPNALPSRTVSYRFTERRGKTVKVTKAKLKSRINWKISKNGYGLLEHTLTKIGGGDLTIKQTVIPPAGE